MRWKKRLRKGLRNAGAPWLMAYQACAPGSAGGHAGGRRARGLQLRSQPTQAMRPWAAALSRGPPCQANRHRLANLGEHPSQPSGSTSPEPPESAYGASLLLAGARENGKACRCCPRLQESCHAPRSAKSQRPLCIFTVVGGTALGASGRSNNGLKLDVKTGKLSLWRLFPTFTFTFYCLAFNAPACLSIAFAVSFNTYIQEAHQHVNKNHARL